MTQDDSLVQGKYIEKWTCQIPRSIHFARLPTTYRSYNISLRPINNITYRLIKTLAPLFCALRSSQPSHRI
ncbi:hypothetical protein CEP52_003467 [Fusarium oligoseptatum]|uniref:Uncharacterized protein n=1 Tax=Fusarium oligoseptatum TaxID=2604345 RepID=A0A428U8I8_9HYPO|nr:hypothetical protein CEP52_003467 [Fusarium oligoseptatum]